MIVGVGVGVGLSPVGDMPPVPVDAIENPLLSSHIISPQLAQLLLVLPDMQSAKLFLIISIRPVDILVFCEFCPARPISRS
jgi:hypothetical protein